MRYTLLLALFIGCTSSVQVTSDLPPTVVVPADSAYGTFYGGPTPVVLNPDCDSIRVAEEMLSRVLAEIQGQIDGYMLDMDVALESSKAKDTTIHGLKRTVENLRARVSAFIREQAKPIPVPQSIIDKHNQALKRIAELEANQEKHSWWYFVQFAAAFILAGLLAGFLLPIVNKIRAFFV